MTEEGAEETAPAAAPAFPAQSDGPSPSSIAAGVAALLSVPPEKRLIETLQTMIKTPDRDVNWDDILTFYSFFGRRFEGEEQENAFKKKFNPENKQQIKSDIATAAMADIFKQQEFLLTLQVDAKVLDQKTHQWNHHAADLRYMLNQIGEPLQDQDADDLIREALGKGDDLIDLKAYLELICTH
ncbi:hypothetical protein TVAG_037640 [Trichomonas vaginalis G3]|uniref:Uncharacterized protein n=1 Tax=Trichomonas vaginalis (strain ATCC PRA-98 / G3) TaxID=412133 RepID=A2FCX1_TRIV3|nr:EF-hand family [Trichomonas vaginalis G3]EAX97257.1 hypothetical protein TVAG_037640 [Trichomonas vaginalis G3]KAI5535828.1 EF-hand family [Trichomonas vaginalis G3]|eukprot:XP_001310187.1 hypothetical protein [Trichomonas vaginalis G3]